MPALVPSMARLAIALDHTSDYKGLGYVYRLWLIAHHDATSHGGRGWIMRDDLIALCGSWHARTVSRLLARGSGVFWTFETDRQGRARIRLVGQSQAASTLRALARHYGIWEHDELSGRRAVIAPNILFGDYKDFAAAAFKCWLSVQRRARKRITLRLLGEAWGRTSRQIVEWQKAAGIETRQNWGETNANDLAAASPDLVRRNLHPGFDRDTGNRNGFYRRDDRGNYFWRFQRANTLHGDVKLRWKRGRVRHITRTLNCASDRGAQGLTDSQTLRAATDIVSRAAGRQVSAPASIRTNYEKPAGLTIHEAAQARRTRAALPGPEADKVIAGFRQRAARRSKRVLRAFRDSVAWHPDRDHYLLRDILYRGDRLSQVWQWSPAKQ